LTSIIVLLPLGRRNRRHLLLDGFKNLAGGQETDVQLVTEGKNLLIEKTCIQPQEDEG